MRIAIQKLKKKLYHVSNRFESFSRVVKKFDLLDPHKLLAMSEKKLERTCRNLIQIYSELNRVCILKCFN